MASNPAMRPLKSVSAEATTGDVQITTPLRIPRGLFWRRTLGVWRKELQIEWRARYSLSSSLLFALSTLVILSLVVGPSAARSDLAAALLWIVLLFSATAGLGHNFAREVEAGTLVLLRQAVPAGPVLLGKWLAAISLIGAVVALVLFAASVFFAPVVGHVGGFLAVLALGTLSLAVTIPLIFVPARVLPTSRRPGRGSNVSRTHAGAFDLGRGDSSCTRGRVAGRGASGFGGNCRGHDNRRLETVRLCLE